MSWLDDNLDHIRHSFAVYKETARTTNAFVYDKTTKVPSDCF